MSGPLPGHAPFINMGAGGQLQGRQGQPGPAMTHLAQGRPQQQPMHNAMVPANAAPRQPHPSQMQLDPRISSQALRISPGRINNIMPPPPPQGTLPPEWEERIVETQDAEDARAISTEEGARKKLTTYHLKRLEKIPSDEDSSSQGTLSWKRVNTIMVTNLSQQDLKKEIDDIKHNQRGTVINKINSLSPQANYHVDEAGRKYEEIDPERHLYRYELRQLDNVLREMTAKERQQDAEEKLRARSCHRVAFGRTRSRHEPTHKMKTSSSHRHHKEPDKPKYMRIGLNAYFARVPRLNVNALQLLRDQEERKRRPSPQYSMAVQRAPTQFPSQLGSQGNYPAANHMAQNQQQAAFHTVQNSQGQLQGQRMQQQLPQQQQQKQLTAPQQVIGKAGPGPQQQGLDQARRPSLPGGNQQIPQGGQPPFMRGGLGQPVQNNKQQQIMPLQRGDKPNQPPPQGQNSSNNPGARPQKGPELPGGAMMIQTKSGGGNQPHHHHHPQHRLASPASSVESLQYSDFSDERASSCSSYSDDDHLAGKKYHGGAGQVVMVPNRAPVQQTPHHPGQGHGLGSSPPPHVPMAPRSRARLLNYTELLDIKEEQRRMGQVEGVNLGLQAQIRMFEKEKRERQEEQDFRRRRESWSSEYDPRRAAKPEIIHQTINRPVPYRHVQGTSPAEISTIVGQTRRMSISDGRVGRDSCGELRRQLSGRGGRTDFRDSRRSSWEDLDCESDEESSTDYLNAENNPFGPRRTPRYRSQERRSSTETSVSYSPTSGPQYRTNQPGIANRVVLQQDRRP
ncbi:hypothetical protein MKZ38_009510 [Zalerion maritima]|uniref:Uncharacterized protein n=1 Tax=Zalerion maritima TaxID=339359 RepID=A0AAD5WV13_9PEZI|nr:hypothetical protein MKZ38_009510 [Zalerion maritima]